MQKIVVLSGAGLSAESGIRTFRDTGGLWEDHAIEDVATPEAFARNPKLVQEFYNMRRRQAKDVQPNPAHEALARLWQSAPEKVTLVTQNIEDLLTQAGAEDVVHMHGSLFSALCLRCGARSDWREDMGAESVCPACDRAGGLRPDIVWFGEIPYHMERIEAALADCDMFVSVGTSGTVYPAAGFVQMAQMVGARRVELNMEATAPHLYDESHQGPASETVPAFVDRVLGEALP
ncbi:NAD-dependent deacylase [Paracoccaceae bacterium GXU_MW_L88]